jgi:DNA adenine methylase
MKKKPFMSQKVRFGVLSYDQTSPEPNSIVYCDPPYRGTCGYKSNKGSNVFDHDHFYSWCDDLAARGLAVFVSEFSAPSYWEEVWSEERWVTINDKKYHKRTDRLFKVKPR